MFIYDILQILALGTAKLSVVFFYRSIFCGKTFNIASWTMVGVVIAWTLGAFCASVFQCAARFHLLWSSAASIARYCNKGSASALGGFIPDVITDGLIFMMPLYWVIILINGSLEMLTSIDLEATHALLEKGGRVRGVPFRRDVSCSKHSFLHIMGIFDKLSNTIF